MRIREENCNLVLLAAVAAVSVVVVGIVELFGPATAKQEMTRPADVADSMPVRVVGAPFVPNVDPHRR